MFKKVDIGCQRTRTSDKEDMERKDEEAGEAILQSDGSWVIGSNISRAYNKQWSDYLLQ